jgi:hypothetical protein
MTLLALAQATGELSTPPRVTLSAAAALLYLIVAGSLLGYTAYIWLLARMPVMRVASHAYVNPIVALVLAYFVGGETLTLGMLLASALVIASVTLILVAPLDRGQAAAAETIADERRNSDDRQSMAGQDWLGKSRRVREVPQGDRTSGLRRRGRQSRLDAS